MPNVIQKGETATQALRRLVAERRKANPRELQTKAFAEVLALHPHLHCLVLCEANPGEGNARANAILAAVEGAGPAPRKRRR